MLQLTDIQKKQFSDKVGAESDLLAFLKENEDGSICKVELQPKPESLNSINGFVTYDSGERYFFKTHTEENEKVSEYYNAEELARAGYPVITSKQITQKVGKQIVLYQIITFPTLFDLLKIEEDKLLAGTKSDTTPEILNSAQTDLDKKCFEIYEKTLQQQDSAAQAKAPIHQLFSHRLAADGRLGIFYEGKSIQIGDQFIPFDLLSLLKWKINGVAYGESLGHVIERSRAVLNPVSGPSIIGHGDAHNGNIFVDLDNQKFFMFDPAFAGRHHPLLDLTKPLFHNIFARWMYYPEQVAKEVEVKAEVVGDTLSIEHDFYPSPLRLQHLESRIKNVLRPTVELLKANNQLPPDWRSFIRSSLFCCPFLTVNLFAKQVPNGTLAERYPLSIKHLGLAMAIELGSEVRQGNNKLTAVIDEIFA